MPAREREINQMPPKLPSYDVPADSITMASTTTGVTTWCQKLLQLVEAGGVEAVLGLDAEWDIKFETRGGKRVLAHKGVSEQFVIGANFVTVHAHRLWH